MKANPEVQNNLWQNREIVIPAYPSFSHRLVSSQILPRVLQISCKPSQRQEPWYRCVQIPVARSFHYDRAKVQAQSQSPSCGSTIEYSLVHFLSIRGRQPPVLPSGRNTISCAPSRPRECLPRWHSPGNRGRTPSQGNPFSSSASYPTRLAKLFFYWQSFREQTCVESQRSFGIFDSEHGLLEHEVWGGLVRALDGILNLFVTKRGAGGHLKIKIFMNILDSKMLQ